jgi:hypothetical protein
VMRGPPTRVSTDEHLTENQEPDLRSDPLHSAAIMFMGRRRRGEYEIWQIADMTVASWNLQPARVHPQK